MWFLPAVDLYAEHHAEAALAEAGRQRGSDDVEIQTHAGTLYNPAIPISRPKVSSRSSEGQLLKKFCCCSLWKVKAVKGDTKKWQVVVSRGRQGTVIMFLLLVDCRTENCRR